MNPWEMYGGQPEEQPKMPWEMYASQPATAAPNTDKNFFERVGDDITKRSQMAADIQNATRQGKQTKAEEIYQLAGKGGAGLLSDIVGEGVVSAGKGIGNAVDYLAPNVAQFGRDLVQTPIVQGTLNAAGAVGDKYKDLAQEYPRAARNLEAGVNLGAMFVPIKNTTAASVIDKAAAKGANAVAKTAGNAIAAPVQGVGNLVKGAGARDIDELTQAAQAIRNRSQNAYATMRANGATLTPRASGKLAMTLEDTMKNDGIVNARLHDKTISVLNDFKSSVKKGELSLEGLDQWRQLLGEVAGDNLDKVNARKASVLIDSIDNYVDNISPADLKRGTPEAIAALKEGRSEWRRARKFEAISDIVKKSDGDANYLKRELKKFADNPKKTRGFTAEEVKALREASKLTAGEGVLKMLGKFGFDLGNSRIGNGVAPVVGGLMAGGAAGTGIGAAVPVVGTAARQAQKYIARGKAEKLLQTIEK